MGPQQAVGNAMESADPHAGGRHLQQLLDPPAHLVGGLVGESDRQQTERGDLFGGHQKGNPVNQYPGLTRAGTRQHQQGTVIRRHCVTLGRIQTVEKIADVIHRGGILPEPAGPGSGFEESCSADGKNRGLGREMCFPCPAAWLN